MFTYGSGLGDGSTHQYSALPILVAGSGGGKFITGKHLNVSAKSGLVKKGREVHTKPLKVEFPWQTFGFHRRMRWV
jgi:hypothetical protein